MGLIQDELAARGYAFQRGALDAHQLEILAKLLPLPLLGHAGRNLLWQSGGLNAALDFLGIETLAREILGPGARPINILYFDKMAGANWKVPGHQDRMMPVERQEPGEGDGYTGWCTKAGVVHVEPPVEVLAELVALRIHLDDCPASNGALAVVPGSHQRGKLTDAELSGIDPASFVVCEARAGDVLAIRPLIVHRSSPAEHPDHRRVLHVIYAPDDPAGPVRWRTSPLEPDPPDPEPPRALLVGPDANDLAGGEVKKRPLSPWLRVTREVLVTIMSLITLVAGVGVIREAIARVQRGEGGVLRRTFLGYKVSPLSVLVLSGAALVVLVLVAPVLNWWFHRHERDFRRKHVSKSD